jgi:cellulose synthase/poly-beta-1,6-N-acetylglucosamine synthase-like glycosyltransferase
MTIVTVTSLFIVDRQPISRLEETFRRKLPKLSLVIPTFNQSQNIREVVGILVELLDRTIPEDYESIVVDDDSPDRTTEYHAAVSISWRANTRFGNSTRSNRSPFRSDEWLFHGAAEFDCQSAAKSCRL